MPLEINVWRIDHGLTPVVFGPLGDRVYCGADLKAISTLFNFPCPISPKARSFRRRRHSPGDTTPDVSFIHVETACLVTPTSRAACAGRIPSSIIRRAWTRFGLHLILFVVCSGIFYPCIEPCPCSWIPQGQGYCWLRRVLSKQMVRQLLEV